MKQHRLAAAVALVTLVLAGCDSQTSVELKTPAQKASYGIGLNMGKSLAQEGMDDLDSKAVALGIEDAVGKKEQKIKDDDLVAAFADLQKRAEERMTKMNAEAQTAGKKFLEDNAKKDGVVTTASGLQYQVIKKADGAQPKPTDVVTVHYEGKLIDGKVFFQLHRTRCTDRSAGQRRDSRLGRRPAVDARGREGQAVHSSRPGVRRAEPEPDNSRQLGAGVRP